MINQGVINGFTINGSGVEPEGDANTVTGRSFTQSPNITAEFLGAYQVTGKGFTSASTIYGGGVVKGGWAKTTLSATVFTTFNGYVTGDGFATTPVINAVSNSNAGVIGRGFKQAPAIYGGSVVTGRAFNSFPVIQATASEYATVIGQAFKSSPVIAGAGSASAVVTGRGFSSTLLRVTVTGRGFASAPIIGTGYTVEYAEAFVMNLITNQVSRYQNFPFLHLARMNGQMYGVTNDGVYVLEGSMDINDPVTGTVWTGDMDFGTFHSKNTPYLYLNGDDTYTVTAYVDGEMQPPFVSGFSGRRIKLARGNKGRYWSFKLEGINKLQGIEFMPDELSRRVK